MLARIVERLPTETVLRRLVSAVESPERVPGTFRLTIEKTKWFARRGRVDELIGFLGELVSGSNPHYSRLTKGAENPIEKEIHGHTLELDPQSEGISRTLLSYGTHEHRSTEVFKRELARLRADVDGEITVLEIGANIGYFALLEAAVLGKRARIYAIEPAPVNRALLERNVALNGYEEVISTHDRAVGDQVRQVALRLSRSSNWNTVHPVEADGSSASMSAVDRGSDLRTKAPNTTTLAVAQTTIAQFITDHDIEPASVNVVRMDIEGYEIAVFERMDAVLEARTPLLLHMELHLNRLDDRSARRIVDALDANGFSIVSAVNESDVSIGGDVSWYGRQLNVETFRELLVEAEGEWVELIARR